jgi:hypothetical protein
VVLLQNDINMRTDSSLPGRCFPGDPGPAAAGFGPSNHFDLLLRNGAGGRVQ